MKDDVGMVMRIAYDFPDKSQKGLKELFASTFLPLQTSLINPKRDWKKKDLSQSQYGYGWDKSQKGLKGVFQTEIHAILMALINPKRDWKIVDAETGIDMLVPDKSQKGLKDIFHQYSLDVVR